MLAPELETRPWAEQLALDDRHYCARLAYLFVRSGLYRRKLAEAGCASERDAGGLTEIARLPLTDRQRSASHCLL